MTDEESRTWPAPYTPTALERTSAGRFPKGISGNPAGRPRGAKGKFSEALVTDFARDWQEHGAEVVARVRVENPVAYLSVASRLVPREFLIESGGAIEQMSDEELIAIVVAARHSQK